VASVPIVAIVGRPNVGKSTLFNRLAGARTAIVEDRARTTRDRIYADAEWNGRRFLVVDTGGLELDPGDSIEAGVQEQARLAIAEADLIVFVVDAATGLTPADEEAAELMRRAAAPVFVAANKADNDRRELDAAEFWRLGWEEIWPLSALHGRGVADMLDSVVAAFPPESADEAARRAREVTEEREAELIADELAAGLEPDEPAAWVDEAQPGPVTIALVGRPNVGKSSLLNTLVGHQRAIVSPIPGTTRDAIDTRLGYGQGEVVLVDTAGIRRRGKVAAGAAEDRWSTLRALKAIDRADVAVLVIDAVEGLTAQDAHVAGYAVEAGKGIVLAINKWDLVEGKSDRTFDRYVGWIRRDVPFLDFAPVVSLSAKTGQRADRVLELAVDVWGERRRRIPTGELNRILGDAVARQSPPPVRNRRAKLYFATQAGVAPPTFVFFVNDAALIHFSYRRYLENRIRDAAGFMGTPVRLVFRNRGAERPRRGGPGPRSVTPRPTPPRPAAPHR
jgi:GTPase